MADLNAFLHTLPRARAGRFCDRAGFHVAVAAALAGGLLAGRSLPLVAIICITSALSIVLYTYVRRWITGREKLVLLEQAWIAVACVAGVAAALGEPVLACLDLLAPALALYLAGGRAGCLLAGCCHGRPSSLGIVYGEAATRDGFPRHLVGVRLFPVQAMEGLGLLVIGITGLVALPFAADGRVFAWFLAGYAVLRFGTEGLRGDARPHRLGMSASRRMAMAELGAALWIARDPATPALRDGILLGVLGLALVAGLVARRAFDRRPALLAPAHAAELRALVLAAARRVNGGPPAVGATRAGVTVAVSHAADGGLHVSLSLRGDADLEAICHLAAAALPSVDVRGARLGADGILHLPTSIPAANEPHGDEECARALYGAVVRRAQATESADVATGAESPAPPVRRLSYFGG